MQYCEIPSPLGPILVAADDAGLRYLSFQAGAQPLTPQPQWQQDPARFTEVRAQLAAYFAGELSQFDLPLAPQGTEFQRQVWQALTEIPFGHTASYGDIAKAIGRPKAVRALGAANGRNPIALVIPCHRVIGADGSLTGYAGGLAIKQQLLTLEQGSAAAMAS
ncbi:methylated-DNA--[protein]-cysteine S-methyltransferase [Ferrimonas marina]|uniref:Methylated-DNA--protein-cysteine methyltransferase n=1 Tax=Ferrimonas marina TaxID=299255 RepID=A0A1M5Z4T7_9GAMM|nr:methylated-DNA--[protein]-cysteine S-methyltransferase [Ferrimonas marina]SHI19220.1 methylated-DNA-[protein]-cysteine S-methyltransferase [Ferrimonas marina]